MESERQNFGNSEEPKQTISSNGDLSKNNEMNEKNLKKKKSLIFRFGCLRSQTTSSPDRSSSDEKPYMEMESVTSEDGPPPTHLVVMVNGILGSPEDWRFAAKQFLKRYPKEFLVHCSNCNTASTTLDGVDVMGDRLADEVLSVVKRRPELQKISFVAHSLGGLVARYAIGRLYSSNPEHNPSEGNGDCSGDGSGSACLEKKLIVKIAGLEPMNFITVATPHLGSRGHRQVPVFCGLRFLEKTAKNTSWLLGRTGKHLFLIDEDKEKPPLLLQMVNDCGDLRFMSALQSFKRRAAYANVGYDHLVGWTASSIRRRNELPKRQQFMKNEKYPHIKYVEAPRVVNSQQEAEMEVNANGLDANEMDEVMIRGLNKASWERVDVSFHKSRQRLLAHTAIQVKTYSINYDGVDVIFHMIDNFLP
ncbi:hypothetical protein MKX03_018127 [Papaver bracteatum]|nr:hypothetical protein MKX03_018127 [Papaver bracteatum]